MEVVRDDRAIPMPPKRYDNKAPEKQTDENNDDEEGNGNNDGNTQNTKRGKQKGKKRKRTPVSEAAKLYRGAVAKRNVQEGRVRSSVTILGMVRRKELTRAYQAGKIDQNSVWEMQYGKDPRDIPP